MDPEGTLEDMEDEMYAIADVSVIPLGVGLSLSAYIAACEEIFEQAGLQPRLHAYGPNVEGEWDQVFAAVKRCHERLHELGVPRISTTIKVGTRTDRLQTGADKVESVQRRLGAR